MGWESSVGPDDGRPWWFRTEARRIGCEEGMNVLVPFLWLAAETCIAGDEQTERLVLADITGDVSRVARGTSRHLPPIDSGAGRANGTSVGCVGRAYKRVWPQTSTHTSSCIEMVRGCIK